MLYHNNIWINDIDIISSIIPDLNQLVGQTVMITGATGLICSAIVDVLFRYNDLHNTKIKIIIASRSYEKVRKRFPSTIHRDDFTFLEYDASKGNNYLDIHIDYIIHGASNASPDKIIKEPVETMLSNFMGTKCLLDYAKNKTVKRVLYISSSEVYGRKTSNMPNNVNDYGGIDILNHRNSYSVGKCAAETLCVSYYNEYGVDSIIVRPGHIYGPTATTDDNRVSSAWVYDVAKGNDIVMKSDGAQIRSYCYCLDAASAILTVLLKGDTVKAYNISNPTSIISIRDMAKILAKITGVKVKLESPTENEKKAFNTMTNSSLDSTELQELGWKGIFNAEQGFKHTIQILSNTL